jgi:XamI restriction endonuclease
MPVDPLVLAFHRAECAVAKQLYIDTKLPGPGAVLWDKACLAARDSARELLDLSKGLLHMEDALQKNAGQLVVLRRMLAPPQSQDQFKLICKTYSKDAENKGRAIKPQNAKQIAAVLEQWLDADIAPWVREKRPPTQVETNRFVDVVATLISAQVAATLARTEMANAQEQEVIQGLIASGWKKLPSKPVTSLVDLPAKEFMHKTLFATDTQPQEVDIACGLGKTVVVAMECKVSNDATNSIKRINDVLKKAEAWKTKWGLMVGTAVLLQGVIASEGNEAPSSEGR